jgi:hypothetical protein
VVPALTGPATEQVAQLARQLFGALGSGDVRGVVKLAAFPFQLEGQRLDSADALSQEWLRQQRNKRTDLLALDGLEVLTPQAMEQRYGPPPARLAALPWQGPRTLLAVGTLSGRPAVAIFREESGGWRLVGFHD